VRKSLFPQFRRSAPACGEWSPYNAHALDQANSHRGLTPDAHNVQLIRVSGLLVLSLAQLSDEISRAIVLIRKPYAAKLLINPEEDIVDQSTATYSHFR
jgi:hypothetical protein